MIMCYYWRGVCPILHQGCIFMCIGDITYFPRITLGQKAARIPTLQACVSGIVLREG